MRTPRKSLAALTAATLAGFVLLRPAAAANEDFSNLSLEELMRSR